MIEYKVRVWHGWKIEWYKDGKLHREDEPAVERSDGYKAWYINGKELTKEEFNNRNKTCDGKIVKIEGKKYKLVEVI